MKIKIICIFTAVLCSSVFFASTIESEEKAKIDYGSFTEPKLQQIVQASSFFKDEGEKIDYISSKFLGTAYKDHTLTGDINTPEIFTINLKGVDCFTYLDYVEGLAISKSFNQFGDSVKKIRYQNSKVDFKKRNHFFSDWPVYNKERIKDVTKDIGGDKAKSTKKFLNKKKDGSLYLPGIAVVEREIAYIPSESIDDDILNKMNTGDYAGIYTDLDGLDVSHTGIIIKKEGKTFLRHASSKDEYMKVVDEDLIGYFSTKAGIIIYRAN
ncbi:MAG TPA: N-acetylmuramoyl-L-alanine amidase-like domain-containing protein [Thermodesulfobacteriota bacterium]|nr:N-acetylmuramoyl-L-alanine amidase-like domain-containing protein [Thermodesulfobacteriota bacterium]